MDRIDHRLSSRIYISNQQTALGRAALLTANSGDVRLVFAIFALLWFFGKRAWRQKIAVLGAGTLAEEIILDVAQHSINRRRPEGKVNPPVRDTDPTSFPSGHAARTTTLATIMIGLKPAWVGLALLGWAISVSLSRVAIGRHFISDTLAGMAAGGLIGGATLLINERIEAEHRER